MAARVDAFHPIYLFLRSIFDIQYSPEGYQIFQFNMSGTSPTTLSLGLLELYESTPLRVQISSLV